MEARSTRRSFVAGVAAIGAAALTSSSITPASAFTATGSPRVLRRSVIASDRQGFNRRWFAPNVQAVFIPSQLSEVAPCVEAAITEFGRDVKVVSGRHCYEDFVYNSTTRAIIDMSALNHVGFDPDHGAYFLDAGADNWSAYRTLLNAFGRTLPDGSCASVGAGGHISGGGYGLMSRAHGLSIDWVTAIDVVTWDAATGRASLRHVSESSSDLAERDLFWALRGAGGGSYGVIARFYFADPPLAPSYASIWTVGWDWADLTQRGFATLLAEYADWVAQMPEREFSLLKLNHLAAGQVTMIVQYASQPNQSVDEHLTVAGASITAAQRRFSAIARFVPKVRPELRALRPGAVRPGNQSVQHLTFLEAVQTLSGNGANQFGKYKSSYLRGPMPTDQVEALYAGLQTTPKGIPSNQMAQSLVQVDSYGGAINRVASDATAVPQRSALLKLQFQTYWNNASRVGDGQSGRYARQQDAHLAWVRGIYEQTYAASGGTPDPRRDSSGIVDGCYANYPDSDLGTHDDGRIDQALWLYYLDNFRRNPRNLVAVKRYWDATDVFHHAQSIPVSPR